jgi:hypothetical protein
LDWQFREILRHTLVWKENCQDGKPKKFVRNQFSRQQYRSVFP